MNYQSTEVVTGVNILPSNTWGCFTLSNIHRKDILVLMWYVKSLGLIKACECEYNVKGFYYENFDEDQSGERLF